MEINNLAEAAERLAANTLADINNASTRIEHVRLTATAMEAQVLAKNLRALADREALGAAVLDFPTH